MTEVKYVFVTGGVTSSLGKGIISASLAKLLQARGYSVTIQKLDPYINVDPGTLNPYEHGECYVTVDGAETDLDLGHYERFLNVHTTQANNVTTGRIYQSVINKERRGDYLGKTVQIIPHITDEIKRSIKTVGSGGSYEIVITEIGGTVGDIESLVKIFADEINGVVLWDPDVPATSNVASTAAGAENLLPIPKNPSPDSLYQRLISGKINLPVRLDLCNKFTGRSMIPDTNRTSTGSKKCDAYIWAMEKYLKTGLCNPLYQGYYIDSFWIKNPAPGHDFQNHTLTNHDYFISHKGFFWDLSVWADETPIDDPCQPLGSDFKILQEILAESLRLSNHRAFIHVGGFTPWAFKYTDSKGAGGRRGGVETEWETVRILSAYNAYIDADALHLSALANASVFQHLPLPSRYAQPLPPMEEELRRQGLLDEKGAPAAKTYLLHYVGDYDVATWTVNSLFTRWDAAERGSL